MQAITLELPDALETWDEREIKTILAAQLYAKGKLTLGQAANVVGVSKALFMELLPDCGVSFFNYTSEDLETDLINVKSHRN